MPPRRIQGVVLSPGNIRAVCSARVVLVDVSRAKLGLPVQPGVRVYVTPPRVRIEDIECGRVNFVHAETGIQIRERRDRGSYPGRRERSIGANVRPVVSVEDRKLILVGVTKENISDDMWGETVDDLVKEIA